VGVGSKVLPSLACFPPMVSHAVLPQKTSPSMGGATMALVASGSSDSCAESAMPCEVQHRIDFAAMCTAALRMDHVSEQ
jgi:hypothetical protein